MRPIHFRQKYQKHWSNKQVRQNLLFLRVISEKGWAFNMNYRWLLNRIRNLLFNSKSEWMHVKQVNYTESYIRKNIIYPLLILLVISHFIGQSFAAGQTHFASAFWFTLAHIISIFCGYYLSAIVLTRIGNSFVPDLNKQKSFQYVAFSMVPFLFITILINLAPSSLYFLKLFYLYSLYLLWQGSKELLGIKESKQLSFVLIALFIIYATIQTSLLLCIKIFPISTIKTFI